MKKILLDNLSVSLAEHNIKYETDPGRRSTKAQTDSKYKVYKD
jgi:hypothetical protein